MLLSFRFFGGSFWSKVGFRNGEDFVRGRPVTVRWVLEERLGTCFAEIGRPPVPGYAASARGDMRSSQGGAKIGSRHASVVVFSVRSSNFFFSGVLLSLLLCRESRNPRGDRAP